MKPKGFTLIELLVVIAVIAMLLDILVPVLSTSREKARSVECGAHLRQLYLKLANYSSDHSALPYGFDNLNYGISKKSPPGGYIGHHFYDDMGAWWFQFLSQYAQISKEGNLLWCPSRRVKERGVTKNILCGNYGANRSIFKSAQGFTSDSEFIGDPMNLISISRPAETMLVMDSGYALISWYAACASKTTVYPNMRRTGSFYVPGLSLNKGRTIAESQYTDARFGRHGTGIVNAAFADGHVDQQKSDALQVFERGDAITGATQFWNIE